MISLPSKVKSDDFFVCSIDVSLFSESNNSMFDVAFSIHSQLMSFSRRDEKDDLSVLRR
jgi:hypothetical protein